MGPQRAAKLFLERCGNASSYEVTLYGALAATGKGHMTDVAIEEVLKKHIVHINWKPQTFLPFHPKRNEVCGQGPEWRRHRRVDGVQHRWRCPFDGTRGPRQELGADDVYDLHTMADIQKWCYENGRAFWEYVEKCEDKDIWDYLRKVWETMKQSIRNGLNHEGVLPGPSEASAQGCHLSYQGKGLSGFPAEPRPGLLLCPGGERRECFGRNHRYGTYLWCLCVLPAVLYHMHTAHDMSEDRILRALATAGLAGNIVKNNASISGADVGCQGEVGVACAMASAAACQLFGGSPAQVEYAAEMGLEHHLGMTCDPVCGLVQIPCIERNAFAAARALDADLYASFSDGHHSVSFDRVVEVMRQTGHDLPSLYKETSEGGLAKGFKGE